MQLLKLREQRKWSLEFVASRLDVSRTTVFNWEHEKTSPKVSDAIKLAELFGVTLEYLVS